MRIMVLALAAAGAMQASTSWATDARIPDRYHGVWEPVSGGAAPGCAANDADIRMQVEADRIQLHEGVCVVQGIVPGDGEAVQIQTYCEQEDSDWAAAEEWSLRENGGQEHLIVTSLDPGNSYEAEFGRCAADGVAEAASASAGSEPARSYCYREEMSELRLTTLGDGTAEFDVESAQGGAHICGLAGTATSLTNGYRYVEEIDGIGSCELSILFDDSGAVSFEDPDWICKQYYCGARAAFEHIRFSDTARVDCD